MRYRFLLLCLSYSLLLGSQPLHAQEELRIERLGTTSGGLQEFRLFWQGQTGSTYLIEHSTDLVTWNDWDRTAYQGAGVEISQTIETNAPKSFWRLVIFDNAVDTDNDGLPDAWETHYFGDITSQGANDDFDGDRFANIFEFHHITQPNSDTSQPTFSTSQTRQSPDPLIGSVHYLQVDPTLASETTYEKKAIQAAVDEAYDFDIIEVLPGIYNEFITVYDDARVFLFSRDGARSTIIDGSGLDDVIFAVASPAIVDGFTIQDGGTDHIVDVGAGMWIYDMGGSRIISCLFINNRSADFGGAMHIDGNELSEVISCTFVNNYATNYRSVSVFWPSQVNFINSVLWNGTHIGAEVGYTVGGVYSGVFENCLYQDSDSDGIGRVFVDGINQGTSAPGLTRQGRLTFDSPARDAALTGDVSRFDMDGEERSDGLPDIGVDEWVGTGDGDLLADAWELEYFGNLNALPDGDDETPQPDGLSNYHEFILGFDPTNADTSGKSIGDLQEAKDLLLNGIYPAQWSNDSDQDGLSDIEEFILYNTSASNSDTNGDGLSDLMAVELGISATDNDTDGDGLTNAEELALGTSPFLNDTDGDGIGDATDPLPLDADSVPAPDPGDSQGPVITLETPEDAVEL